MTSPNFIFRSFHPDDLPEILRLQEANLISRLSPAEKADGFLSVAFPPDQFIEMHAEIPLAVAESAEGLGGYMCGSSLAASAKVPLLARMISLFPETLFEGKSLDNYRAFVYGPVCIDRSFRGQGVLEGLFGKFKHQLAGRFDIGVLFVSLDNPRSMRAHTQKLVMQRVREFNFKGNPYAMLVFDGIS
jgi:hypothetical protein